MDLPQLVSRLKQSLLGAVCIAAALPAVGAIAIVQQQSATGSGGLGGVEMVTLGSPVASGDSVVYAGICGGGSSAVFTSITDDKADTYPSPDANYNTGSVTSALTIGHLSNVTSGPSVFTYTGANCGSFVWFTVYEISGMANSSPVDANVSTNIGFGSSPRTHAYTTAQSGELAITAIIMSSTPVTSITGWTIDGPTCNGTLCTVGHLISPASGSNTLTVNSAASTQLSFVLVTYEAAAGASCTHSGITLAGALVIPNGSTGSYRSCTGTYVTPDCSTIAYKQPTLGTCSGVN